MEGFSLFSMEIGLNECEWNRHKKSRLPNQQA